MSMSNEMGETILDSVDDIGVVDVYDLASSIGKECEKIIEIFGPDIATGLMPKVISTLELLEALAIKNERESTTLQELNDRITQLESEKLEKAEFRRRFEKELETIEEQWRSETKELVELVNTLQEENKRIVRQHQELQSAQPPNVGNSFNESVTSTANYELSNTLADTQILQRLKMQINRQRDEIKIKDRELQEKVAEVENLNIQIERLKNSGGEWRRRQKHLQVQVRTLCEERADFLAQLQDQHREIVLLRKSLGIAEKENEDLVKSDENDPNRPRYTTTELKELLRERDELLSRINDLSEELGAFKLDQFQQSTKDRKCQPFQDEDPPVQGPLPYEPDDAPWRKSSESGIRKFFRKLFSERDSSSFPRRSLTSLSKMALSAGPSSNISFQ